MQVKCTSCGALCSASDYNSSIICSFCGTLIEIKSSEVMKHEINIIKCDIKDGEIKYINRGIKSIQDLISLYSDVEIDKISKLTLNNNIIKSLKGVSHFTLFSINLTGNNLSVIDEIPNLKRGEKLFFLNVRNNSELSDISEDVISSFNLFKNMWSIKFYFDGCPKFNFDSLGEIKFKDILLKDKGNFTENPKVEIEPSRNVEIPSNLREMGFKKFVSDVGYDGYYIQNIAERNRVVWILEIKNMPENNIVKRIDLKKEGKTGCFIATAAMGNYNHPVVMDLRIFRDNWLLKRHWGINFTKWYYAHGPKAANVIEKSKLLKLATFFFVVKPLQLITKLFR